MIFIVEEAKKDFLGEAENSRQRDARLYPWHPDRLNLDEIIDDWIEKSDVTQRKVGIEVSFSTINEY